MKLLSSSLSAIERQYYLQHLVAPRPICFASTIDNNGNVNLSPFSFFNMFSSDPPVMIFSPARRVRDNTTKHTLQNIQEVPEVVINIVTYDMVQQVSLASAEYPRGIDEFVKAGFTKEPATMIQPPIVKESRAALECKVTEVKSLGDRGGAGQLVIAEVLCMHIDDELLTSDKKFIQDKLELVARLGADWYAKITPQNLFKVRKPNGHPGIGIDALPGQIRKSNVLTGNHLAQLANVPQVPARDQEFSDSRLEAMVTYFKNDKQMQRVHGYIRDLVDEGAIAHAWQVILSSCNGDE